MMTIISTTQVYNKKRDKETLLSSNRTHNEGFVNVEVRLFSDCEEKELCDLIGIKFEQGKYGGGRCVQLVTMYASTV